MSPKSTAGMMVARSYMIFRFSNVCVNGALLGMNYKYEKGAVQTLENLRKMYDLATIIPAVMFGLMALILFVYYPLSRKRVAELQIEKEAKLRADVEAKEVEI